LGSVIIHLSIIKGFWLGIHVKCEVYTFLPHFKIKIPPLGVVPACNNPSSNQSPCAQFKASPRQEAMEQELIKPSYPIAPQ
jgi:hypothetical protein